MNITINIDNVPETMFERIKQGVKHISKTNLGVENDVAENVVNLDFMQAIQTDQSSNLMLKLLSHAYSLKHVGKFMRQKKNN